MWKITIILILAFLLRVPFFSEPLDYDEGTYAFFAFFSKGENFYSSLPLLKLPGIIFTYRFLDDLFPGNIVAFRVAAAILVVVATFGVYQIGRLLYSRSAGFFAAMIFAIYSSQTSQSSPANTEFFMAPFMVLAVWLFLIFKKSQKISWLILSGLFSGLAVLYKQVAVFEVIFLGLWLILINFRIKRLGIKFLVKQLSIFCLSFLFPFLVVFTFFLSRGELADFWYQSFGSGSQYLLNAWQNGSVLKRAGGTFGFLWLSFWPLWLVAAGGFILMILVRKKENLFLIGWLVFALIGVSFNGWFFPHYFFQVFPPLSLLGGLFLTHAFGWIRHLQFPKVLIYVIFIPLFALFLASTLRWPYYQSYLLMLQGKIGQGDHFKNIGQETGENGWLAFYESADYLKSVMKTQDSLFVWSTTPLPYYLVGKYPTTSFILNYSLLDYKFMLPTYLGWKFDFEGNRQKLMKELISKPPTYILMHVTPEQIFDQMSLFRDFARFVDQNYETEKKFGNILVFRLNEKGKSGDLTTAGLPIIPLELVKRFAAITNVETKNNKTEINFEPMVNPGGVLRELKVIYPEIIKIDFTPITIKFLGQDGSDFVGAGSQGPSGVSDLHFQIKEAGKPISFIRVKSDKITWNSKGYGVNLVIQVIQSNSSIDLYLEPPSDWKKRKFEVYIIHQDGNLAQGEIKWKQGQ